MAAVKRTGERLSLAKAAAIIKMAPAVTEVFGDRMPRQIDVAFAYYHSPCDSYGAECLSGYSPTMDDTLATVTSRVKGAATEVKLTGHEVAHIIASHKNTPPENVRRIIERPRRGPMRIQSHYYSHTGFRITLPEGASGALAHG